MLLEISAEILLDEVFKLIVSWGPKLLLAIFALVAGFWLIKRISKLIVRLIERKNVDISLRSFLVAIINIVLKILLIISVLQMVGIETTSFVAMLGAGGLAIGMALQGSLSNFAGGVLILLFKPYKVGDLIDAQGYTGTVDDIQIFTTKLKTAQGNIIVIPNAALSNGNIVNHTVNGINRVDIIFNIDYNADIDLAKNTLLDVAKLAPGALQDPVPTCVVHSLGDSSVNIRQSTYCNPADYWNVYYYNVEYGKKALDKAGVNIPFPQMDVFIKNK